MKQLIISADDFGMTDGVSLGIIHCMKKGCVTSTSVMPCLEGSLKRFERLQHEIQGSIGVHLQLNFGRPCCSAEKIPSLMIGDSFPQRPPPIEHLNPVEVELEWCAQIESVIDIAPKITHIDSHHNFHRFDSLKDVYIRVAKRYGLAARGGNRKYCKRLSLQGVKSADYCESAWSRGEISAWNFLSLVTATFNELNDFAIVEIITHPGFFDCSLQTLSSLTNQRNEELKVLSSTDLIKQLGKQNIKLVSYEELNHR